MPGQSTTACRKAWTPSPSILDQDLQKEETELRRLASSTPVKQFLAENQLSPPKVTIKPAATLPENGNEQTWVDLRISIAPLLSRHGNLSRLMLFDQNRSPDSSRTFERISLTKSSSSCAIYHRSDFLRTCCSTTNSLAYLRQQLCALPYLFPQIQLRPAVHSLAN